MVKGAPLAARADEGAEVRDRMTITGVLELAWMYGPRTEG
jgi:hypothetical protein